MFEFLIGFVVGWSFRGNDTDDSSGATWSEFFRFLKSLGSTAPEDRLPEGLPMIVKVCGSVMAIAEIALAIVMTREFSFVYTDGNMLRPAAKSVLLAPGNFIWSTLMNSMGWPHDTLATFFFRFAATVFNFSYIVLVVLLLLSILGRIARKMRAGRSEEVLGGGA